jgi:hypothetical protein
LVIVLSVPLLVIVLSVQHKDQKKNRQHNE